MKGFWSRHRRKFFFAMGTLGCGYAVYKLYNLSRKRALELEREDAARQRADELVRVQIQTHFEKIQSIAQTTTLPYAMQFLRSRIAEELDILPLTEKLMLAKGHPDSLQPKEKLELWERIKVLSFTRTAASVWAVTALFLYVKVQLNIVGRHLYLETARDFAASEVQDGGDPFDRNGKQEFLATADYLSNYGISSLILKIQNASNEVVKDKQLREPFSSSQLSDTIMQILELFMNFESPESCAAYVIPPDATVYQQLLAMSSDGFENRSILMDTSKLDQLLAEARVILTSADFRNIMVVSMKKIVHSLIKDLTTRLGGASSSGTPLAKLLPQVAKLGPTVLEDPNSNRYISIIQSLPEVELFNTLIYSNTSQP